MTALADIRRPLQLFAEAVSGLHLDLDDRPDASTDDDRIALPSVIDDFAVADHNRRAYRLAVLREVEQRASGALSFDLATAAALLPSGAQVDVPPATLREFLGRSTGSSRTPDLDRFLRTSPRPLLARQVLDLLEHARIDAALCRRYPGVVGDVRRAADLALSRRPHTLDRGTEPALLEALTRWASGARDALPEDLLAVASPVLRPGATVYDSAAASLTICALIISALSTVDEVTVQLDIDAMEERSGDPSSAATLIDDAHGAASEDGGEAVAAEQQPEGTGTAFSGELDPLAEYLSAESGGSGGSGGDASDQGASARPPDEAGDAVPTMVSDGTRAPTARRGAQGRARIFLYDEWDHHQQTYLREWCRLLERAVDERAPSFMHDVRRDHAAVLSRIRRRFAAVRPEARIRVHGTSDGDELSIDALIGSVIDRRTGHAGDEHLYIRRDRGERDVAVAFLLDLSGSTDSPIVAPTPPVVVAAQDAEYDPFGRGYWDVDDEPRLPPGRRVIDVAKEALALVCDSLHTLGDRHAIFGFSGRGRHEVEFLVAKDFDERPSARTWSALGAMEPMRYTRMGPAIRHAASKLAVQTERTRVLLVVSDGYPQDEDYGPDRNDPDYGIHDTAQALREAESAGITTFCITVDPAGHDYLRRMCPEQRYLVIDDIAALTGELEKIYSALTTGRR